MRRVDSEGNSRGIDGRTKGGARNGRSPSRSVLRRLSLEGVERLELRQLLSLSTSTLPAPTVNLSAHSVSAGTAATSTPNADSPSVAIDPADPTKLVAAWVDHDTANPISGQITSYVEGAFSINGGRTWRPLTGAGSANSQTNFSISQTNGPFFFHQTTDAAVTFGRDGSVYLLTSTHDDANADGVLDLQRYDFSGATPTKTMTNKQVYAWEGGDSVSTPTIAVDNNVSSFTDSQNPSYTQSDPFVGNVYIAWASTDTAPKFPPGNFNPQTIKMVSSSDQGKDFTHQAFVDDTSNANQGGSHSGSARYAEPSIAISQGSPAKGIQGGQVTIVYDDYGTGATAGIPFDRIVNQTDLVGGTAEHFAAPGTTPIVAGGSVTSTIAVNINDANFKSLQNLDVSLKLQYPNLAELSVTLTAPNNQSVLLFGNATLTGANLGNSVSGGFGTTPGTVFDADAVRSILDGSNASPYLGHYNPQGNLNIFQGLTAAQLNGTWTLTVTSTGTETSFNPAALIEGVALDFTSGNNPGATSGEVTIADNDTLIESLIPNINPAVTSSSPPYALNFETTGVSASPSRQTASAVMGPPILPTPVIASDNTLGAFSPNQGRIYVAYTGRFDDFQGIAKDQTDIMLVASDDGGQSWFAINPAAEPAFFTSTGVQVNDDNALTDGYSEGVPGENTGRPQLEPQVAVDQYTGTVVVSFLDTRDDASRARVATYVAVSNDGGNTFAPETFANLTNTATDAVTGQTVNLGPVPDNQSAGNENRDATVGFGQHQALAVADGKIIPVWSSNENLGASNNAIRLSINSSVMTTAGGPRIISSTMGAVGQTGDTLNTTRAADGSPVANSILVTFDRAIDPTTFTVSDVNVYFKDPAGDASVKLNVNNVVQVGSTNTYKITFNPTNPFTGKATGVGTYSYGILPGISDQIRHASGTSPSGNLMDQNADGVPGELAGSGTTTGDDYVVGQPPGFSSYIAGTLPLIVSGPHIVTTTVTGVNGGGLATGSDHLITNDSVDSVQVTFDRNVQVGTVTGSQLLNIQGPAGPISAAQTFSTASAPNAKPMAIPQGAGSSLASTLNISDPSQSFNIAHLAVRLDITAPKDSDLLIYLVSPDKSVTVPLIGAVGGVNFSGTTLDDNATVPINSGTPPYTQTYRPSLPAGSATLESLIGKDIGGAWTLLIRDPFTDGLTATLNSWSLIATPQITIVPVSTYSATAPGNEVAYAGTGLANVFKVSFPTQQLSGTYSVTLGTGILAGDGSAVDANLNAGVDALQGTPSNGTTPETFAATSLPLTIPAAVGTTPGILMSSLVVPDNFPIQGVTAAGLAGLTLTLNITYPNDPDLTAFLLAPDGQTKIFLFSSIGSGTNHANFTTTTFDDTAGTPIDFSGAPFFGTFKPDQPLSDLATLFHLSSGGTWTLVIQNTGTSASSIGTLNNWSLKFQKPVSNTGLGEPIADRETVNFRIFNIAPANPLTNDTWTAVGPAGITTSPNGQGAFAGPVASVAVDLSDPTGNTVFVAASSGGIWKTNNFLTTSAAGPTYLPLTDFGPNFGLNVGSMAIFDRNNNPDQSIVIAGTGFAQGTTTSNGSGVNYPNVDGNAGRGVGFLRSMDGGATWTLLDSMNNFNPDGTPIPEAQRDHHFIGDTTYKVVVDPTPLIDSKGNANVIIYAALGGPTGGLYRSLNSGNTWQLLSNGFNSPSGGPAAATDVILDPASKSPSTGNVDIIYAAFQGIGVFMSTNRGQSLNLMTGQLGLNPLITGTGIFPQRSTTVGNSGVTPNGAQGRIVLAKPAITGNTAENIAYQGWLYAAVEGPDGHFNGLYVTKDGGENWTKALLSTLPTTTALTLALPTNDNKQTRSYDPTANDPTDNFTANGGYTLTMTIDPTNPNIVYLGGTQDFQDSGLIRVDLTNLYDAHNFTSFSNNRNDGGKLTLESTGSINVANPTTQNPNGVVYPDTSFSPTPFLNFRYAPNTPGIPGSSPFNINATLQVRGAPTDILGTPTAIDFNNDGTGVTWSLFDEPLKANEGDLTGSSNLHNAIAYVDPVTGDVRMIFADDQGVFTALVNPDGSLNNGIGSKVEVNYSRNGNLQDEQFYYGAAQPSNAAAQIAGALFYASGKGILAAQSDPNILSDGNITWDNSAVLTPSQNSPRNTLSNQEINTSDRSGVGIATDQTAGGVPGATSATTYEYDVPALGGSLTDFFRVNGVGQTTGLVDNYKVEFPFNNNHASGTTGSDPAGATTNGEIPLGNFTVNPIDGTQILIGSSLGRLYETTNKGAAWNPIGQPNNFDGTQLSALTYGAPDPNGPNGIGNLNDFIYVGTTGSVGGTTGHIYVTQTGGTTWQDISSGLDGSSVVGIYASPDRASHAAYAVTLNGIFYSADTLALPASGQTVWTNITSNLASITKNAFGDSALTQTVLSNFQSNTGSTNQGTAQYGGFTSIVADYRYAIPNGNNSAQTHPVLYVSGYGGVFRSLDNGTTWTVFPNTAFDSAPVDGGYLPSVDVANLQLDLGTIDPATGHPTQTKGDPEILLASTFGRGEFAIGLAPDIIPGSIQFSPAINIGTVTNPKFSTNDLTPTITGISEVTNFGNVVTITLTDLSNGDILGTGTTDASGKFSIQIVNNGSDPTFFQNSKSVNDKAVGIQATDKSGAKGNTTTFTYTLVTISPSAPTKLVLDPASDSGRSNGDTITNLSVPPQTGPGAPLSIVAPVFDVSTTLPPTNPLSPNPIGITIELFRANSLAALQSGVNNGTLTAVATAAGGINSPVMLTDNSLAAMALMGPLNTTFFYEAIQVDVNGNQSNASPVLMITVDTVTPPSIAPPKLDPTLTHFAPTNPPVTNNINPGFDVSGLQANDQVFLFRAIPGSAPILVGSAPVGSLQVRDQAGAHVDGTYVYSVAEQDVAGNFSLLSSGTLVTIDTQVPVAPTLNLLDADDSGLPSHPNVTNDRSPRFVGTAPFNPPPNSFPVAILVGETASSTQPVNLVAKGSVTSFLNLTVPTGQQIAGGIVSVSLANTSLAGGNNIGNLSATLTGPGGQTFVLPIAGSSTTLNANFSLPAAFLSKVLNGAYTLKISDARPGDSGQLTSWGVTLFNGTNGVPIVLATTNPAANGTYLVQIKGPIADGTYSLIARTTNLAGTSNYSTPLTVTIKATGPRIVPSLSIATTDDTGIKGDGVTANHRPKFSGITDKGDTVTLYSIVNGVLSDPQATTVASTVNGSFTFQLPFNLTNGSTQLVAQATDIANNKGPLSPPLSVRIITVAGDYLGIGAAQLTLFDPNTESYLIRNIGIFPVDTTPGRDIPVQNDYNGDGATDLVAYRFNTAEYFGGLSDTTSYDVPFGPSGSLPVSGDYGGTGTYIPAAYQPSTGTWYVALPRPGGLVTNFGFPGIDVPVPAAYDGVSGGTEIAVFRPQVIAGGDADAFIVFGPRGPYAVSFTSPAVQKLGFTYQPGDIPAPADYDGVGKDEFAVYRPSTGTFFILKTPDVTNAATWTLRTVTLNIPNGPNVNDVPASEDYDGNGKADPTVYRPSTSTFFVVHSSNNLQENIPFGYKGLVAAGGPLLYRLSALKGVFSTGDGFPAGAGGAPAAAGIQASSVHAESFDAANLGTTIAVAAPMPAPTVPVAPVTTKSAVTVGVSTPRAVVPTVIPPKPIEGIFAPKVKATTTTIKKSVPPLTVVTRMEAVTAPVQHAQTNPSPAQHHAAVAKAVQQIVTTKKSTHQG